jgi:ABC-type dipeptide/oligopeptide/nickel transport system permease component
VGGSVGYIGRRLGLAVVTLLGVAFFAVVLLQLLPGDPARTIAGLLASEDEVERIRDELALDRPVPLQYGIFIGNLVQGDLGTSARTNQPVLEEILGRMPATLTLALTGSILGAVLGVLFGVLSATRRSKPTDYLLSFLAVTGVSLPVYWLGMLLIILFAVNLRVLPASGAGEPSSIILPSFTLALFSMALVSRMTRASMLEVLERDYVRTARAKGVRERAVIYRHALRNAAIPIVTVIGLQFGSLLGGAVLTETVFGWPGVGRLLVDSIFARDLPVVLGIVLVYSLMFIVVNLIVDVVYTFIDPRVRFGG